MKTGIYPGSFDPITLGHLDIIKRAALVVDKLIIGVLNNSAKKSLFTPEERVAMIQKVTSDIPNVEVENFNGLLVDFADQKQAHIIVRGLRAISDFEYELQIAQTNRKVNSKVDTMFFTTSEEYSYISSSIVKEYAMYGGDVSQFVTPYVETCLKAKIKENR